jgi:hypothetical protein
MAWIGEELETRVLTYYTLNWYEVQRVWGWTLNKLASWMSLIDISKLKMELIRICLNF